MGWLRQRTRDTMTWLDCYGIYREAGVNQYQTQEALDGNSEFVLASQADMQAGADAERAENVAATQYAGEVLMAIGAVVGATGFGLVLGILVAAVGAILTFFADLFYVECDKYHCSGHDRKYSTQINRYKEHVKAMVGVQGEDERSWDHRYDCGCDKRGHRCSFVKNMHDGLVIEGIDWDAVEGEPTTCGVVRGANAMACKDKDTPYFLCTEYWRLMQPGSTPLNPRTRKRIPKGGSNWPELYVGFRNDPGPVRQYAKDAGLYKSSSVSQKDIFIHELKWLPEVWKRKFPDEKDLEKAFEDGRIRPFYESLWLNPKNSYYFRAWRVQKVLYWMTGDQFIFNNILCRTMKCMEEVFEYTVAVGDDSQFNQRRRRGSRWYASIVWMMRDIWRAGQQLIRQAKTPKEGWTQFGQVLQDAGCSENALNELRLMATGHKYPRHEVPWPFWPLMQYITFTSMREILIKLKPFFPYEYKAPPTGPMPQGEAARGKMLINVPVLESISFDREMQPIPAKLGTPGPGLGTIMLGLGAAAVGTYAIYKLLAPAKD